jgi:BirA family biotin operon repressor/biotin-[acetyl-CoA-carboxylase] ligase
MNRLSWVPLMAAVGAARAITTMTAARTALKWPNDLLLGGRKVGGLLCEGGDSQSRFLVVGIGINVNTMDFPPALRDVATSLALQTGHHVDRLAVLAGLVGEVERAIEHLPAMPLAEVVSTYESLCTTVGRSVRVQLPGDRTIEGLAESIGPDGALRVRTGRLRDEVLEVRAADIIHVR